MSEELEPLEVTFSVNEYDQDGDITSEGVFLHIDLLKIKVGPVENLEDMIHRLTKIREEIKESYNI